MQVATSDSDCDDVTFIDYDDKHMLCVVVDNGSKGGGGECDKGLYFVIDVLTMKVKTSHRSRESSWGKRLQLRSMTLER